MSGGLLRKAHFFDIHSRLHNRVIRFSNRIAYSSGRGSTTHQSSYISGAVDRQGGSGSAVLPHKAPQVHANVLASLVTDADASGRRALRPARLRARAVAPASRKNKWMRLGAKLCDVACARSATMCVTPTLRHELPTSAEHCASRRSTLAKELQLTTAKIGPQMVKVLAMSPLR